MEIRDTSGFEAFERKLRNPIYLYAFMLFKLPTAFFCGVTLMGVSEKYCHASIKLKWFTKNPFKSIYFACLAMAAEFSTGVLAMGYCYGKDPKVSMLVTRMEASFHKKATGRIIFQCKDGESIARCIENVIRHGKSSYTETVSYGYDEAEDIVATFRITWSFKATAKPSSLNNIDIFKPS
jgi:hypothetical protein